MPPPSVLAVALLAFAALSLLQHSVRALRWHQGCMCELPDADDDDDARDSGEAGAVEMFATSAIFSGSQFFRRGGEISEFCPCSLESIQASCPTRRRLLRYACAVVAASLLRACSR